MKKKIVNSANDGAGDFSELTGDPTDNSALSDALDDINTALSELSISEPSFSEYILASTATVTAALNTGIAGGGLTQVGAIQVTVTVSDTTDIVTIGAIFGKDGNGGYFGYKVDSDTTVVVVAIGSIDQINWTTQITGLSAGSHTIMFMGARSGGSNVAIYGNDTLPNIPFPAKFWASVVGTQA